jgi:hypothetical protein
MLEDLQDPEKLVEVAEGREVEKRDGATVIRLRWDRLDVETLTRTLLQAGHLTEPDAARLCFLSPGILADNIDPQIAPALAAALQAQGEPCLVVPAAQLLPLPPATEVSQLQLTRTALHPMVAGAPVEECRWSSAPSLALAHIHALGTKTIPEPMLGVIDHALTAFVTPFGGLVGEVPATMQVPTESLTAYLDLAFTNPDRRYRIRSDRFDFSLLHEQLQPTAEANIHDLARWFLSVAPQVRTNVDAARLLATNQAPLPQLSVAQFDDLTHWLVNLAHFGEKEVSQ